MKTPNKLPSTELKQRVLKFARESGRDTSDWQVLFRIGQQILAEDEALAASYRDEPTNIKNGTLDE